MSTFYLLQNYESEKQVWIYIPVYFIIVTLGLFWNTWRFLVVKLGFGRSKSNKKSTKIVN